MAKMDKKWVILCSTAVAAVYASGYFSTEAQANKLNMQPHSQISMQTKSNTTTVSSSNNSQTAGNQTTAASSNHNQTTANQTAAKSKYKDGTFTGTGQNRRGYIQVAVTLKNDKITDVEISDWGMHYSQSDVVDLPGQVIQRQNAQVDNVSGATYSSEAFSDAVQDAINQATNS